MVQFVEHVGQGEAPHSERRHEVEERLFRVLPVGEHGTLEERVQDLLLQAPGIGHRRRHRDTEPGTPDRPAHPVHGAAPGGVRHARGQPRVARDRLVEHDPLEHADQREFQIPAPHGLVELPGGKQGLPEGVVVARPGHHLPLVPRAGERPGREGVGRHHIPAQGKAVEAQERPLRPLPVEELERVRLGLEVLLRTAGERHRAEDGHKGGKGDLSHDRASGWVGGVTRAVRVCWLRVTAGPFACQKNMYLHSNASETTLHVPSGGTFWSTAR